MASVLYGAACRRHAVDGAASEGQIEAPSEAMLDGCACVSCGDAGAVQSTIHGITGGQVPKPGVGDDEEVCEVEDGVGVPSDNPT